MNRFIGLLISLLVALGIMAALGGCTTPSPADILQPYVPVAYFCDDEDCTGLVSPYAFSFSTCAGPGQALVLEDIQHLIPAYETGSFLHIVCLTPDLAQGLLDKGMEPLEHGVWLELPKEQG